jgi:hypothetical protein
MVSKGPLVPETQPILIDLETQELLTFPQARKLLPKPPGPTTWWRWRTKGVNGIKLPAVKCGNTWMTSRQAILEFIRLQTLSAQPPPPQSAERSPETTRDLKAAGLL